MAYVFARRILKLFSASAGRSLPGQAPRTDEELLSDARFMLTKRFAQCLSLAKDLPSLLEKILGAMRVKKDEHGHGDLIKSLERGSKMKISEALNCKYCLMI